MQVLTDKVEIGVEKTLDLEFERESTGFNEVNGLSLSRDLAGDVSTDQNIMYKEPERVSFNEQVNRLSNVEIEKHTESRQLKGMASFSVKTLLEDTLNLSAKVLRHTLFTNLPRMSPLCCRRPASSPTARAKSGTSLEAL